MVQREREAGRSGSNETERIIAAEKIANQHSNYVKRQRLQSQDLRVNLLEERNLCL